MSIISNNFERTKGGYRVAFDGECDSSWIVRVLAHLAAYPETQVAELRFDGCHQLDPQQDALLMRFLKDNCTVTHLYLSKGTYTRNTLGCVAASLVARNSLRFLRVQRTPHYAHELEFRRALAFYMRLNCSPRELSIFSE